MRTISLFLAALLVASCVHNEVQPGAAPSYQELSQKVDLSYSFGFTHAGHNYNFVRVTTPGFKDSCLRFDGYKDDVLTYSFPQDSFSELNRIYNGQATIDQKIEKSLGYIDSIRPRIYQCEKKPLAAEKAFSKKLLDGIGVGMEFVVYGSMAVIAAPFVVAYGGGMIRAEVSLQKKLQEIHLGDAQEKVAGHFAERYEEQVVSSYLIHTYDISATDIKNWRRLIFIYKNGTLAAYVWGLRPANSK